MVKAVLVALVVPVVLVAMVMAETLLPVAVTQLHKAVRVAMPPLPPAAAVMAAVMVVLRTSISMSIKASNNSRIRATTAVLIAGRAANRILFN